MHIVIVGGGFGGVKTALELASDNDISVTLISDKDQFVYYPALYSAVTGHSHLSSIVDLKKILNGTSVHFIQDTITGYDPHRHIVRGKKDYHYDRLVFAMGVVTSYFDIPGLAKYSFGIKSIDQVARFKAHLHDELVQDRHMDKHYIIVGAGATGVELAAALASYLRDIAEVHQVKHGRISIQLVEAAPRVLPRMSERASRLVTTRLKKLGVTVKVNERVQSQDDDSIIINNKDVPTQSVVWTSGVANHPFFATHSGHFELAKNGRVIVDDHLMINPTTYVIGDNADTKHTGLAQTALHDAIYVAKDIVLSHRHRSRPTYKALKPPIVIPVGANWAVLEWHGIVVVGVIASLIRRAADLIGYSDILPIGQALGVWRAERIHEETCLVCKKT